jgi:hypothetical protein
MLPFRGRCLRLHRQSTLLLSPLPPPTSLFLPAVQIVRQKATIRKKKKKSGEFQEKESVKRLRLKRKLLKEQDKKLKKIEKLKASKLAEFKLPPHQPRPDAIPFGTAMRLLRAWGAKGEIFVRSRTARWAGETKVVAMVRVVPNDHSPRGIKGLVQFPHPVVFGKKDGAKKERIAVILDSGEGSEEAKKAGMVVGGKEYLEKVCPSSIVCELMGRL